MLEAFCADCVSATRARIVALTARVRALEAALRPFAGQTERLESWGCSDDTVVDDSFFTIADYKRVDAALSQGQGAGEVSEEQAREWQDKAFCESYRARVLGAGEGE
jgi:pyruvate dehydrogenase complex dehydrogenase (E1) component